MDQRISLVTLGVRDLERAAAFYDRLGWRRSVRGAEGVAFYQVGGMALALWPRADLAADAGIEDSDAGKGIPGFAGIALAYNTRTLDEVDAVLAEAKAAGGTIVRPAQKASWGGYTGYFADTEGNLWEVAHNTGFAMADDGSLILPD
ncbi:MAG: VOC family protein [Alphaproteobacteria bacterium]